MRADGPAGPDRDDSGKRDLAYRLLAAAVTLMRPGRRDWGLAMLAELEHVCHPAERAWFALGAARVALFPPRATQPWRAVSLGLAIRAVAAGAAMHALAPAAGLAPAALMALPAAGVWTMLTMPALAGRPGGAVLAAQVTVAAGIAGFLVLYLTVVQHYPQVMGPGNHHGWGAGLAFNLAAAGYLGMAWLLPRRFAVTQRNILYALTAGLVMAAAAARDIAHPSGISQYALACLALPTTAALASIRRGRVEDGLETARWATLLAGLTTFHHDRRGGLPGGPFRGRQPAGHSRRPPARHDERLGLAGRRQPGRRQLPPDPDADRLPRAGSRRRDPRLPPAGPPRPGHIGRGAMGPAAEAPFCRAPVAPPPGEAAGGRAFSWPGAPRASPGTPKPEERPRSRASAQ